MAILTLRPNAVGTYTQLYYFGGDNYLAVDDVTPDEATTTVANNGVDTWEYDTYNLPNHTTQNGVISSVTIYCRVAQIISGGGDARIYVRTNSANYATNVVPSTTWTTFQRVYTTNPQTSSAWTWSEIDALQIGVGLYTATGLPPEDCACTQIYAVVTYTPEYTGYKDIPLKMSYFEGDYKDILLKASLIPIYTVYKDLLLKSSLEGYYYTGYKDIPLKSTIVDGEFYSVQIGGNTYESVIVLATRRVISRKVSDFEMVISDGDGTVFDTIEYQAPIYIQIAGHLIFYGFVENRSKVEGIIKISGRDYWAKLQERYVSANYSSQTASYILGDIITDLAPELLQSITATTITYDREYRNIPITEIIQDFCSIENFQAYINSNNYFIYEPEGYSASGVHINYDTGEGGLIKHNFEERGNKLKNVVTVTGAVGEVDGTGIAVQVRDEESILKYGVREIQFPENALTTVEACREKARWYLNRYSTVLYVGTLKMVGDATINVGETILLTIAELGFSAREFLVVALQHTYAPHVTELTIADFSLDVSDLLQDLMKRIKKADTSQTDSDVTVTRYVELGEEIEVSATYEIYKILDTGVAVIGSSTFGGGDVYGPYEGAQELIDSGSMVVTNTGLNLIRNWLAGDSVNPPDNTYGHIGVGIGTTPAGASDTDLEDIDADREVMDSGYPDKPAEKQLSWQSDVAINEHNVDITEVGLFNALGSGTPIAGGIMLCRQVINKIEKDSSFSLKLLITLTLSGV